MDSIDKKTGLSEAQKQTLVDIADTDKTGIISYTEFLKFFKHALPAQTKTTQMLNRAGGIDNLDTKSAIEKLREFRLNTEMTYSAIDSLFKQHDADRTGTLNIIEFKSAIKSMNL